MEHAGFAVPALWRAKRSRLHAQAIAGRRRAARRAWAERATNVAPPRGRRTARRRRRRRPRPRVWRRRPAPRPARRRASKDGGHDGDRGRRAQPAKRRRSARRATAPVALPARQPTDEALGGLAQRRDHPVVGRADRARRTRTPAICSVVEADVRSENTTRFSPAGRAGIRDQRRAGGRRDCMTPP